MKRLAINLILICCLFEIVSTQQVDAEQKWFKTENNKTYYIEQNYKYSWYQAFLQCSMKKMALLTIETPEEHNDVAKILKEGNFNFHGPHLWIGAVGFDRQFAWIANSQPVFTNRWVGGNPDNFNQEEHCLLFSEATTELNDAKCEYQFGFICEENAYLSPKDENQEKPNRVVFNFYQHG
ncbi:lectin subunit alpha-like [Calliphora vicina]|uniref:lectin subunit alpha-like n=1 Tax=Calliphora vicina TaxID=7373 RepID=UPI00325B99FD